MPDAEQPCAPGPVGLARPQRQMPTPFEPEDLFLYKTVAGIHCAPDSELAVCVVESIDREQDSRTSAVWLVPLNGDTPRQFTSGSGNDDTPRWSPDGSQLAFLSARSGGVRQIYLMPRNGGEAQQLTRFNFGAMSIEWSPDGQRLLATCKMQVDPERRGKRAEENGNGIDRKSDAPKLIWRLPYKSDGIGYLLSREVHLFAVDASTGDSVQLTDGPFEVRSAEWAPDGRRIAFTRTREARFGHRTDVWMMDVNDRTCKQLSQDVASTQYPRWSPDGRYVVFTGTADEGDAQLRLWLIDIETATVRALGDEAIEVVAGDTVHWSEDSSEVIFVLARHGRQEIACVTVPTGHITHVITGDRQVSKLARTNGRLVYVSEDASTPNDVYCASHKGDQETRLTDFNTWWKDRLLPRVELRSFDVPDGEGGRENVDGWLLRPANGNGPVPLLIDVHGGPASYVLLEHIRHLYWQVLVSRGWGVLAINPVGSSSYGRAFSSRLRGHWGQYDLDQHLAAVEALKQDGIADHRVAMTGKSYGGFMTAWAISHASCFLRAAVVMAPVTNLETHYGTSDSGYYADPYAMYGEPYMNRETSRDLSPMKHAEMAQTPTLILQGEEDERCPKCQSEELFVTLMRGNDTPAEMVLYPGGSHHMFETGKPSHCVDAMTRLIDWVEGWIDRDVHRREDELFERNAPAMGRKQHEEETRCQPLPL
jgi:dipeptidyl aminopeptidase/acylaminoacyl peptidase